jgi:hypothetical protein
MSAMTEIPLHFVTEFDTNWTHLAQQKMSKARECVTVDTVNGKEKSFNQMGSLEMQRVTLRAGETRITDTNLEKRWLRPYPHDLASLFDEWDEEFLGSVVLPSSQTVQAHGMAYGRLVDKTIIDAALGTAYTGETGTTATTLPSGQLIAVDFVETGSTANSGLTVGKLRQAKYLFDNAEVDEEEQRTIFVSAKQIQDLLRATEVTSKDYNTVQALAEGKVNSFMGFTFKRLGASLFPYVAGTGVRTIAAVVKSGVVIADKGKKTLMDVRADKSHALQIRTVASVGGTRSEEVKVVGIYCDEVL